jgi:hypothetical protein
VIDQLILIQLARPRGRYSQARPVSHHQRDSIEAHLTIVFAALAVSRWIERHTSWSIRKFVRTARRYRSIRNGRRGIDADGHHAPARPPRWLRSG